VPQQGTDGERLRARVKERVRSGLRFDVDVEIVDRLKGDEGQIVDRREWK